MLSADCLVDVTDQIQPARLAPRALAYGWTFRGHDARVGSLVVSTIAWGRGTLYGLVVELWTTSKA